jgi:fructose 1,6-bisphosphate aldolase/phosphatase
VEVNEITLSAIKADVGSVGGHLTPSWEMLARVKEFLSREGGGILIDHHVTHLGDDICLLLSHREGVGSREVHKLAWEAFKMGARIAREAGLYGAGQDLLRDAFSGNVRGLGPGVAELSFLERPGEAFLLLLADKTSPGALNLPLYLAFADPMHCSGLILSPSLGQGFRFTVMDVAHTKADRVIELDAPEDLYDLAALLRDNDRFVIEKIHARASGDQAVACSTTRLTAIAGRYVGKDDPVAIVRVQKDFPATGEVLAPFALVHYVPGFMRGSHIGPLMPVRAGTPVSYFDGPPQVMALAFSCHGGRLSDPVDAFDHPFWDRIRDQAAEKSLEIRRQGFFGPAMLGMAELEYTGIADRLKALEARFAVRA